MASSAQTKNIRLRPLCLPALVEERTRSSSSFSSRSSMSVLPMCGHNKSGMPSDQIYAPFRLLHSRSLHLPAITINPLPSSPGSPTWSPGSRSPPDSPPLRTPRIGSGIVYFSTKNPAPLRPLSTKSQIDPNIFRDKGTNGLYVCARVTESPTLDAPSTPEAVIIENTDVATYDERGKSYELEVERTSHSSHGLDKISHSPQEFSKTPSFPQAVTVQRRSLRLKAKMKTVLKKMTASMKMRSHMSPLSPVISPPEPLDLPGYNSSVALGLSSPIQVARFLYAAEMTHKKRHKLNNFPRNTGFLDTSPFKYTPRLIPISVDTEAHEINVSDSILPYARQMDFLSSDLHDYDQNTVKPFMGSNTPHSMPLNVHASLHADIAHTLKSMRSSLSLDIINEAPPSFPGIVNKVTFSQSLAQSQVFDSQLMPFTTKWVQQKERQLQAPLPRTDWSAASLRDHISQLEHHVEHPHLLPAQGQEVLGSDTLKIPSIH